jgi:two-component system sensor histidine kinase MprB
MAAGLSAGSGADTAAGWASGLGDRWDDRRWHYRRSLASRVGLLTTIAVGITVAALALGAYVTVRMQMQAATDASLLDRAERAATTPTLSELTREYPVPSWMLGASDVRMIFITKDREWRTFDGGPELTLGRPELEVAAGRASESTRTIRAGDTRYRVVAVPTEEGNALVLAQSLESQENVLHRLGIVMLFFGVAGMIAAGLAGWGVARNGLRPVRKLTLATEEIARTEELTPIQVEGTDEIARLSTAFNAMLAALAASRDRQRRLVADAGHELRTPLTSLRTNLDLLLQADQHGGMPEEARVELLDDVRAQIEEMTTLIGDLVELARDEPLPHVVEPVDVAEVLHRAVARVRRRAPGITVDVTADEWWVIGESGALERAVTNLLDNAVKWSPPGGTVEVRLDQGELTVRDQGPGIGADDLPHVFDRFYRSQESRSMPGSGLGLSIVRQVALRHSGTVHASLAPGGGTLMTLRLPGTPHPPVRV